MATKILSRFLKGITQDVSKSLGDNQHSYYSLDFDLVAENGEELGIPHNSKGNSLQFTIPDLPPVYTLELDGFTGSPQLSINGIATFLSVTSQTTILDIYNDILSNWAAYIAAGEYGVFYNNNQIYIVGFSLDPLVAVGPPNNGLVAAKILDTVRDPSIIGWCLLDEDIIIATTGRNNTSSTPSNTDGQIWRITYDDATNTINNLSGTSLNPAFHLVKNDILNFSRANEIYREMLGRVESSLKGNVYWTDDYNSPRALNIYNPQAAAIPPGLLDWKPEINTTTPLINGLLNGGNLKVGTYQFSYQLYSADGAITNFSPTSMLIPINDEPFGTTDYFQFDGAEAGTNGGKSIRVKIPFIDTRYDYIKVAVIIYEVENVPQIFTFVDQPITNEEMEFLYTGNENHIPLTTAQFLNPNISFDTVKTIAQKKNRLYPTNTTTNNFDIDWDSRAYRFDSGQLADLYERNDTAGSPTTTINGAAPTYPTSDTLSLVNPYNDESGQIFGLDAAGDYTADWLANYQFKYQADGVTIGGTGDNISYTFFVKDYIGDSNLTTIPTTSPFISVTTSNPGGTTQDIFQPNITELEPTIDGWDAIKNPFYNMVFPSYARGEVYRFGIVFYNNKGQQSFVKWIGDIRIPEPWEDTTFDLSAVSGVEQTLRAIGITFTIDTSSLPSDITGFRIVRVERTDDDKTRFGTGFTTGLARYKVMYAIDDPAAPEPVGTNSWLLAMKTDVNGVITQTESTLEINFNFDTTLDSPINLIYGSKNNGADPVTLGVIKFPDFDFDKYQINQASHIKKIARYNIINTTIDGDQNPGGTPVGNMYWSWDYNLGVTFGQAFLQKFNSPIAIGVSNPGNDINIISEQTPVGIEGQVISTFSAAMGGMDYNHVATFGFYNGGGPWYEDNEVCGLGTKMLFVNYQDDMDYSAAGLGQVYTVVALCRFNQGAYGGPWRSARYNNVYQACSDFIPTEAYDATSQAIDVFGGDTYVSYYITPFIFFHWGETYGVAEATPSGLTGNYYPLASTQLALAHAFPAESSINPDLRYGNYFNKDQVNQFVAGAPDATINESPVFARFLHDDFLFNDSYKQQNNIVPYLPKPFLITDNEDNRVRTWVSKAKFDRELIDSWRIYPSADFIDLEGMFGESVKILNSNEKLVVVQNRAVAQVSSEELSTVPNAQGQVLQGGTGQLLSRYDYITKESGAFHQHGVFTSPQGIYYFDVRLMKMFRLGNGLEPLTDVEGLSAFFRDNITGDIRTTDQVLLGKGIHGAFDTKYNKAYFTFEKTISFTYSTITPLGASSYMYTNPPAILFDLYHQGQTININNDGVYIIAMDQANNTITLDTSIGSEPARTIYISFTIAYNEFLKAFESFYSFTPHIYLGTGKRLFSANPYDRDNSVYVHNIGNYGEFYDQTPSTSILTYNINYPDQSKIPTFRLDIIEFWSEVLDNQNQHITLETITGMVVENDYQTTGTSLNPLTIQDLEVIRERTWRINRIRDYTDPNEFPIPFLRDKYAKVTLFYDNENNRDFRLHNINSSITPSAY